MNIFLCMFAHFSKIHELENLKLRCHRRWTLIMFCQSANNLFALLYFQWQTSERRQRHTTHYVFDYRVMHFWTNWAPVFLIRFSFLLPLIMDVLVNWLSGPLGFIQNCLTSSWRRFNEMPDTFFSDFGPYSITQLLQFTGCTSTMRISHPNQIPKVLDWRSGDCGNQFGMIWASCHGVVSCWNQLSEDGNAVVRKEVRKKTRNHPPRDHTITPAVWTKKHPNVDAVYTKFWPPPHLNFAAETETHQTRQPLGLNKWLCELPLPSYQQGTYTRMSQWPLIVWRLSNPCRHPPAVWVEFWISQHMHLFVICIISSSVKRPAVPSSFCQIICLYQWKSGHTLFSYLPDSNSLWAFGGEGGNEKKKEGDRMKKGEHKGINEREV